MRPAMIGIGLIALLSLVGCRSKPAPAAEQQKSTSFKLYVSLGQNGAVPPEGLDLSIDGKSVGKITPSAKFVTYELPADTLGADLAPRLQASLATTCGAESHSVRPHYSNKAEEREYREKYGTPETKGSIIFYVEPITEAYVYVDNIGGKRKKLTIGQLSIDVPADSPLKQRIRVGKCAKAKQLAIDGSDAGELSMQARTAKAAPATLIDALGGRCYRRVSHVYKQVGTAATGGVSPPETYKGSRAYAIEHQHDFLQKSPKEYEKFADPDGINLPVDWRIELNRCEGTPARGRALR